jgi:hypoxanthine phosphoribosyltransferase
LRKRSQTSPKARQRKKTRNTNNRRRRVKNGGQMNNEIEILIGAEEIHTRVKELAALISRDYAGKTLTLLCTLKGAVIFLADLAREISLDVRMEFIKVSSYGNDSQSDGKIKLDYPEKIELENKNIIIVEDIVDMGYTASWLLEYLREFNPASLKLCALLDKPERRKIPVEIDYLGFTIPDEFVVGYGLDFAQQHRCLPFIGKIKMR